MKTATVELLAPAGSYEGFEAALAAGADAVYAGGAFFGARAFARNFEQEELLRAIDTAHLQGKKLYLTVNTLLKNQELKRQLCDYMAPFYEAGLDAAIVQDFGVFSFLKREFPKLQLHASTQMTVTGPEGMRFLEEIGASRVVPARELTLEELRAMHRASSIEIETFIHGALCYSYSGQCLFSSMLGGRSGNRGRCAQPCRLPYRAEGKGQRLGKSTQSCPLSLKDICTIDLLPEILAAGVTSLKIEGRMKQPAYTAGVTGMYRKYLDKLFTEGAESYRVEEKDRKRLLELYSRGGSCEGYYKSFGGGEMLAPAKEKKVSEQAEKTVYSLPKTEISGKLTLRLDKPACLAVEGLGVSVRQEAGMVQAAQNQPMEESRIRAQMDRLGNTSYAWKNLEISMDDGIFVAVKTLNELRRNALECLEEKALSSFHRTSGRPSENQTPTFLAKQPQKAKERGGTGHAQTVSFYISCEDSGTAQRFLQEKGVVGLYVPYDAMEECLQNNVQQKELYLSTPYVMRGELPKGFADQAKDWLSRGMRGFLVRNLEAFCALRSLGFLELCVADFSLYTWNDLAVDFFRAQGILRNTAPLELNERELFHRDNRDSELLVYGYLPLMISAQCIRKNFSRCTAGEERLTLIDRKNTAFSVQCVCRPWKKDNTDSGRDCYNIVYNSVPYGLLKEHRQVKALGMKSLRLSFTREKPGEALEIYRRFYGVYCQGQEISDQAFTKGHFKRGAE